MALFYIAAPFPLKKRGLRWTGLRRTGTGMVTHLREVRLLAHTEVSQAPGQSGSRGGWPWRAPRGARGRHPSSSWGEDAGGHARVSFKPERAFNVIAHVRDWEHAETVRRPCPNGQLKALHSEGVQGPRVTCG